MENGASILFELPGVAVARVEHISDERDHVVRLVHVVTTASSAAGYPSCGAISTSVRQNRSPNRMIKDAARIAYGFRNLDNQRRRIRLHCKRTMISQPQRGDQPLTSKSRLRRQRAVGQRPVYDLFI